MKDLKRLLPILFASALNADQFAFQFYNDYFIGTDQHFTNGVAISWMDDTYEHLDNESVSSYSNLMLNIVDTIPFKEIDTSKHYNSGLSLSQIIITPENVSLKTPQYDDIPYAGYLALSFYVFEWDDKSFNEFRVDFGVTGKESGAEQVQNGFHSLLSIYKAEGWDTQLGTEYIANALFRYGEISWRSKKNSFSMDWFNHFGTQVGNFTTDVFAGSVLRIGKNYIESFNVHYPYLREEASIIQLEKRHKGFGWSFSMGINGDLLAYSYVLDEGKREGYKTTKRPFNASLYIGVDLLYNVHKITYFYQAQSPYTHEQKESDAFGGFTYSYQF